MLFLSQHNRPFYSKPKVIENNTRIQLLDSSFMYLHPHTHILLEDNRAEYVGGAIYTNNKARADPCVFQFDSQTTKGTIIVNFVNNKAGYAGSSLYGEACTVAVKNFRVRRSMK